MPIEKIEKRRVSDDIFEQMKKMIADGEWKVGDKIPSENQLTKMYGVSRISVREALKRLSSLGLIEARQGLGTFIKEYNQDALITSMSYVMMLSERDILKILEFRKVIETGIARIAAENATDKDIKKLETLLHRMEESSGNLRVHSTQDLRFHMALADSTGNPYLIQVNLLLKETLESAFREIVGRMGSERGIRYHKRILEAVRARDADGCYAAMLEHIESTADYYREHFGENAQNSGQ